MVQVEKAEDGWRLGVKALAGVEAVEDLKNLFLWAADETQRPTEGPDSLPLESTCV